MEEQRWARIQQEKAAEEANWLAERQAGIKAKRNASVPFDMVTLQYHDSLDGERCVTTTASGTARRCGRPTS